MSASHPLRPPHLPTIGMLTAWLSGPTEIHLWHGVADRTQERNVNLICFSGGIPHWHQQFEFQKNILFDIAGKQNVDGLLIWSNILSHTLDPVSLETFCNHYSPLPVISMGMVLPSIPSIRIDMRAGMQHLLSHLIEVHGRRKIAFIRGSEVSQDAEERYQAYCEAISQYGLPLDPALIVPGDFQRASGVEAIQHLLDDGPVEFDALVSANDNMAIGAMQALQARGVQIPEDVIVAGFDDIEETIATVPSLTTVRAPWQSLGSKSVDLMLSILAGDPVPEQILLQAELVSRQSCGCQPLPIRQVPIEAQAEGGNPGQPSRIYPTSALSARFKLLAEIDQLPGSALSSHEFDRGWTNQLVDDFFEDVRSAEETPGRFIQKLVGALSQISSGTQIIEWQEVLDLIRANLRMLFESKDQLIRAHELLETGYAITGEIAHRRQLSQRLEAENQADRLNRIVQTLSTTYEVESLMKLLALELPGLGIQTCFLSLYDEKGDLPAWSRLIMASQEKERVPLEGGGLRFQTRKLVPPEMLPQKRRFAFDVEALYFQNEPIGTVLFEIGPRDGDVYTALRGHISSALKSAELVQVALEAEAKAKKADQLKTHLLANVSHELRTPINIIMGLSQMALSDPNPYEIDLPSRLTQDLGYIFDSGEHLVRLINDLLDMSRAEIGELDLTFEPMSPRLLLYETFQTIQEISLHKPKNVELLLDIPDHLPLLQADPVRLRQILMNLLSNALKFTQQGNIVLGAEIQLPHIHIWVADTGAGIPLELQERIFEPFVKADPPSQRRSGIGLGLSITRRLVALHGGSITLDSQPGMGSTFHVYIPLPGVNSVSAKETSSESAPSILGWISSSRTPPETILNLCQKKGLELRWLGSSSDLDEVLQYRKPAALAWDLDHARPGDWFMVQKIRGFPQYSHLPLLLFQGILTAKASAGARVTNVLLKPAGKQTLQHILDLLPQSAEAGEIWIVDDDPQAIQYYQGMVRASVPDFLVRAVHGGKAALDLLSEAVPDLVILDLMMPEVDGFQVLERLRGNPKTAAIPVIILTGKMLTYEDIKRLDAPKVVLQTKGILTAAESAAKVQRVLMAPSILPQPTSLVVKQALAYIQQNYTRVFSLQELAETIGVSRSYLSRIFKLDIGVPLWEYLNRLRIQKARDLLSLTDQSITDIAASVGFEDVGYFGRVFREVNGCSPRAFRQQG